MDRSRVVIILLFLLLPLGGLQARLVHLQIVNAPEAQSMREAISKSVQILSPRRGMILDAKSRPLAEDRRAFDLYLVLEEFEKAPWPVAQFAGMTSEDFAHSYGEIFARIEKQVRRRPANEQTRLYRRERRTPYLLCRDIPLEAAIAIETAPQRCPGAVVRESLKRVYPFGRVAGQLCGYLGAITANERVFRDMLQDGKLYEGFEDLIGQDGISQLYHRGVFHDNHVGVSGIEKRYDDALRGRPGLVIFEREPGTSNKRMVELKAAEPGKDIELTIDLDIQKAVENILAGPRRMGAVVLDVRTGAVLALASTTGYDPNIFVPPGTPAKRAAIQATLDDHEGKPLNSWAFAQHFQLGSIFKVVTSVAGLEEKKVRPDELLPCAGKFFPTSERFNCHIWREHKGTHGELVLYQALERSCNCYYYEVGKRVELEGVIQWARAMGYGAPTGLDLPGEVAGALPRRQTSDRDVLSLAIGQHELMVSPLQSAAMMAAIANGGFRVRPHLRRDAEKTEPVPIGISKETIQEVQRGLYSVVHEIHGTAYHSGLREFGAAGKTSSAQSGGPDSHAWFAGYAPYDNPSVAIAVFVEYGGHGGEAAAPVAAKILELLFPKTK
jgi:penicillin-binding protein 2